MRCAAHRLEGMVGMLQPCPDASGLPANDAWRVMRADMVLLCRRMSLTPDVKKTAAEHLLALASRAAGACGVARTGSQAWCGLFPVGHGPRAWCAGVAQERAAQVNLATLASSARAEGV